jgi:hypothetical protein
MALRIRPRTRPNLGSVKRSDDRRGRFVRRRTKWFGCPQPRFRWRLNCFTWRFVPVASCGRPRTSCLRRCACRGRGGRATAFPTTRREQGSRLVLRSERASRRVCDPSHSAAWPWPRHVERTEHATDHSKPRRALRAKGGLSRGELERWLLESGFAERRDGRVLPTADGIDVALALFG